jgi:hypothetical protein
MKYRRLASAGCVATVFGFMIAGSVSLLAAPPLPGAIFTTNAQGTRVNQNTFPAKCDVYLDGGPGINAPQGAAGLPDGDYYFQVTDPSGKTLLSTDAVQFRKFRVSAGIISGLAAPGNHATGLDVDHGAVTIQLCNFLDTPNNGGVYKVWVTPVDDFVGDPAKVDNNCGRGCFHGFVPAASKTDNFKVKSGQLACLVVNKLLDGVWIPGWEFVITDPLGSVVQGPLFTAQTKDCNVFNLTPGTYLVTENVNSGGLNTVPAQVRVDGVFLSPPDDTVVIKIKQGDKSAHEVVFFNNTVK